MPEVNKAPKVAITKAPVRVEKKVTVKVDMACSYVSTGTYNPKAPQNIKSMGEVEAILPASYGEIQAKIPQHADFVGYLIRRGGLKPKK